MFRLWSSTYHVTWTPFLSFERRRATLLDWVESHLEPVAFAESPTRVGIALVSADMRLTVHRRGFEIDTGLSALPLTVLLPAIEGMFEVMEPKGCRLVRHLASSTVELPSTQLAEECERFARGVRTSRGPIAGLTPDDASVLLDLKTDDRHVQVEYGIVGREELSQRLREPAIGRLSHDSPHREEREPEFWRQEAADVSMFIGTNTRQTGSGLVSVETPADVLERAEELDLLVEKISEALHVEHTMDQRGIA